MSGTTIGCEKSAAIRLGLTYEEYLDKKTQGLKWCLWCKSWITKAHFSSDASRKDGLSTWCNTCRNTTVKAKRQTGVKRYRQEHREELRAKNYAWREENASRWKAIREKANYTHRAEGKSSAYYQQHREAILSRTKAWHAANRSRVIVTRLRRRAFLLNVPFNITPDDITIPSVCPVLGIPIEVTGKGQRDTSPSVDRLIPNLGYVKGNVWVISMKANRIKNDASIEDLEKVLAYMRRNLGL